MYKYNFIEQGEYEQDTAKTKEEAKKRFENRCSLCNKQGYCKERLCRIAKRHEAKLLLLEAEELCAKTKVTIHKVQTRPYKKLKPEALAKRDILKFLNRISKDGINEEIQLTIDDAIIQISLGRFRSCYSILYKKKLMKEADTVKNIIIKIKEGYQRG